MRYCTFILPNTIAAKYDGNDYPWSEIRPCGGSLKKRGKRGGLYICRNCDMVYAKNKRLGGLVLAQRGVAVVGLLPRAKFTAVSTIPFDKLPTSPPPLDPDAAMDWVNGKTRKESKWNKFFRHLPDQRMLKNE